LVYFRAIDRRARRVSLGLVHDLAKAEIVECKDAIDAVVAALSGDLNRHCA
jgi:hypothetical protein